jgi:hypothetical protein
LKLALRLPGNKGLAGTVDAAGKLRIAIVSRRMML